MYEFCLKVLLAGNSLKVKDAIRSAYPDIKIMSNCDGSSHSLDHPADYYDFQAFTSASNLFSMTHKFDCTSRTCPKVSMSDYAVTGNDAGTGSLLAALVDTGLLTGLKRKRFAILVPTLLSYSLSSSFLVNLMPWSKYPFCVFMLVKIPFLEAFISQFLRYCVGGKQCTTFFF